MVEWAEQMMEGLEQSFIGASDPVDAGHMKAYMRDQFEFFGIKAGDRKKLQQQVRRSVGVCPGESDLHQLARLCYGRSQREFHYAAVGVMRANQKLLTADSLSVLDELLRTHSWWDTVDEIAGHLVGGVVTRHPGAVAVMDDWIDSDNMWVARAAILHQLHYKERTDESRLFAYCDRRAAESDFFFRKAIGWALRQYARTAPDAVRRYCSQRTDRLSSLSIREATKHL